MIIAQNSIDIDENAKLASEASNKASDVQINLDKQGTIFADNQSKLAQQLRAEIEKNKEIQDQINSENRQKEDERASQEKSERDQAIQQANDARDKIIEQKREELIGQFNDSQKAQDEINKQLQDTQSDLSKSINSVTDKIKEAQEEQIRRIDTSNTERDNIIAQAKKDLMDKIGDMNQVDQQIRQELSDSNSNLSQRLDNINKDTQDSIDKQNSLIEQNNNMRDKLIQKAKDELTNQLGSSEQAQKAITDQLNDKQSELSRTIQAYKDSTDARINSMTGDITSVKSVAHGRSITSFSAPNNSTDVANHITGDLWTQYVEVKDQWGNVETDNEGHPKRTAIAQFVFDGGVNKWSEQRWDKDALNVDNLSALSANLGDVTAGNITGVDIRGSLINGSSISSPFNDSGIGYDNGYKSSVWDSSDYNAEDSRTSGFHLRDGLLQMRGKRTSDSDGDVGKWDFTFIGPNDFKVRRSSNNSTSKDFITDRVDIRSNYIEIADRYAQPSENGAKGVGLYSDGNATITNTLYLGKLETDTITNLNGNKEVAFPNGIDISYAKSYRHGKGITLDGNVYVTRGVFPNNAGITSDLSKKNVIRSIDSKQSLAEVLGTDTYKYHYKGDNELTNIGPVIDDINGVKDSHYNISKYMVTENDKGGHAFALQNAIGLLIGSVHELSKQNEKLLSRIVQLEVKNNGNN